MKLRSIELELPDIASATTFMRDVWGLHDSAPALTNSGGSNTSYLRGTGDLPYLWSMREAASPAMRSVSFSGTAAELEALSARLVAKGMAAPRREDYADEPGGGHGFSIRGFEGQPYRFITGDARVQAMPMQDDKPIELSHVVFNTQDRAGAMAWVRDVLGFTLSDETRIMSFLRCDEIHHAIAVADAKSVGLNHVAFDMRDTDAVMKGAGRLRDHGHDIAWGPGRHGPGNNVFSYFVTPFGATIEYTAEVQRVDANYRTGRPEDWTWPPRRNDHWGIAVRDNARLHDAEKTFGFKAAA